MGSDSLILQLLPEGIQYDLRRVGIRTDAQLMRASDREILAARNIGKTKLAKINHIRSRYTNASVPALRREDV